MREAAQTVLMVGGLLLATYGIIRMFSTATHHETRPWAGIRHRASKDRNGLPQVTSYFSKGQRGTRAEFRSVPKALVWTGIIAFWVGVFL